MVNDVSISGMIPLNDGPTKWFHKVIDVYVKAESEDDANSRLGDYLVAGIATDKDDRINISSSEPWDDEQEEVEE